MKLFNFVVISILFFIIAIFFPYILIVYIIGLYYILYQQKQDYQQKIEQKSYQEILKYRQLQQALLQTQQNLNMSIEYFPDPILIISGDGNLVIFNQKMQLFAKKELMFGDYTKNTFILDLQQIIDIGFSYKKHINKTFEYNKRYYQAFSQPIKLENSPLISCIVYIHDISDMVLKERFQQEFIQNASHDLKTPISVLKSMNEIILRDDVSEQERLSFLHDMNDEILKLETLTKQLFTIAKYRDATLNTHRIDLIVEMAYKNAKAYQHSIQFHTNLKQPTIYCDFDKMGIVLTNLITNAFIYSDDGNVYVHYENDVLTISDEGIGIPDCYHEKVFDRFFRVDQARNTNLGTGLGLAIVKTLLDDQNYTIRLEHNQPKGSKFIITKIK